MKGVKKMPTLSVFYGIIIYMYSEKNSKHHEPHIHAVYQDEEAVISFDGKVMLKSKSTEKRGKS